MKIRFKEKLLLFIFFALPIFDSINGYMVRTHNYYGIGSAYHLFFIVMLLLLTYNIRNVEFGFYEKVTMILVIGIFISVIGNSAIYKIEASSVERIEKIICTFLSITSLIRMLKNCTISKEVFNKIVIMQCIMVPTITIFANVTGIGNYTYSLAKVGKIGFYTGSNEPIAVFIILGAILLNELSLEFRPWKFFLFFEILICLIFAQSKMGYFSAVTLIISFLILLLYRFAKKRKVKLVYLFMGMVLAIAGVIIGKNILFTTINSFLVKQDYLRQAYAGQGFIDYISSGRTTRFESLFEPIFDGNLFYILFKMIFGQGVNLGYYETFEMDYFDAFLFGGVIMLMCFLMVTIKMLMIAKNTKSLVVVEGLMLTLLFSFIAGHVWTGGVSGIYLALLFAHISTFERLKI